MSNLKAFFNNFHAHAPDAIKPLWKYAEYETKFGDRREIQFIGQSAMVIETPPDYHLDFLTIQTQEIRVYKHAGYLLAALAEFYLQGETTSLHVKLYGQGYQAFMYVNSVRVEALTADGMVERVNRFGQPMEQPVSKINGVRVTRFTKENCS